MNSADLQEKLFVLDAPNIFDRGKDLVVVPPTLECYFNIFIGI